jgi:hypothetical protein
MNDPTRTGTGSGDPAVAAGQARPTPTLDPKIHRTGNGSGDGHERARLADEPGLGGPGPGGRHESDTFRLEADDLGRRRGEPSTTSLLRQLLHDAALLMRKELALAASEVRESVDDAKRGGASLVSGGAVLYAGLLFLLGAAAMGLARFMPLWAAVLTIGVVVTLIGLVMVSSGKKKLQPGGFAPERASSSLRKDREAIRRHTP